MVRQRRQCGQQGDDSKQCNLSSPHVGFSWSLNSCKYEPLVIGPNLRDRRQILDYLLVVAARSVLGPKAGPQAIPIEVIFIARELDQFVFLALEVSRDLDWFRVVLRVVNREVKMQLVRVGACPTFN